MIFPQNALDPPQHVSYHHTHIFLCILFQLSFLFFFLSMGLARKWLRVTTKRKNKTFDRYGEKQPPHSSSSWKNPIRLFPSFTIKAYKLFPLRSVILFSNHRHTFRGFFSSQTTFTLPYNANKVVEGKVEEEEEKKRVVMAAQHNCVDEWKK